MIQPPLHDLVACVRAPTCVLSGADGQIRPGGASGLFHEDVRHLSELVVSVDDAEVVPVGSELGEAGTALFVSVVMGVGDPIADPTVRVERRRQTLTHGLRDVLVVVNDSRRSVDVLVDVHASVDLAPMHAVKAGASVAPLPLERSRPTDRSSVDASVLRWSDGTRGTELRAATTTGRVEPIADEGAAGLRWRLSVAARTSASLTLEALVSGPSRSSFVVVEPPSHPLRVESAHPVVAPVVARSLADLGDLLLGDGSAPHDRFAAAGAPWYLTLFGRDSLWTARFALPLDVDLAGGTLRTLARRQAHGHDVELAAEPGKILHEVRGAPVADAGQLPPLYYGSVDATPLWISLLHDAWRWGLPGPQVADLLAPLEAALAWLTAHDAFVAYRDDSGHGLANHGWKDSGDSIQDATAAIAAPPIALCEVQGYAYRAALDGAALLDAFGRAGAGEARQFAARLREAFRESFWTTGASGRFPAVALDGRGRVVDSLTSNIGHLPATGILDAHEIDVVATQLASPALAGGYGLRTLAADHPAFNPLGYHTGSVWPHDTAIAVEGLAATGHDEAAAALADGLLAGATYFDHRLPELFGGRDARDGRPLPYPAACHPQAWAAASAVVLLRAALGLEADVPGGTLTVRPRAGFGAWFPLRVTGLRVAGHGLDVDVDADGAARVSTDAPLTVVTGDSLASP